MKPKISIVTATLNRKDFLPRCIEAVTRQAYPHKEHIIIDGGSTDGTVNLLKSYTEKYPHVRWISEKDTGISNALNKGLAMVTGDIIGINGDDDSYEEDAFEIVETEFERNPTAGVVSGNCAHIRNDGTVWITAKAGFTNRQDLIQYWKHWGQTSCLPAPSTFFRRQVVDVVGGFDEADRYAMDYHHWIKISARFDVKTVDKVLAKFRCDDGTVSFSHVQEQLAEADAISRRYWGSRVSLSYYKMAFSHFGHFQGRALKQRLQNFFKHRAAQLLRM